MVKDGKYRFSLQFGCETEEQIRAGKVLEKLGNKKSALVVAAVNDYITAHPELLREEVHFEIRKTPTIDREQLEKMIRTMIEDRLSSGTREDMKCGETYLDETDTVQDLEADVAQMLTNLDLFL